MDIRTTSTTLTQTHREANAVVSPPTTIVTATAVVVNPLAGQGLVQDLSVLEQLGNEVATLLVELAVAALASAGIDSSDVRGYGKGAIVGIDGDREHTAAVLHPRFGAPVRAAIGGGADIIANTQRLCCILDLVHRSVQRLAVALTLFLELRKLPDLDQASPCQLEIRTTAGFLTTWIQSRFRCQTPPRQMKSLCPLH